jgi:hypothetical protein
VKPLTSNTKSGGGPQASPSKLFSSDLHSQHPSSVSPRLYPDNRLAESKSHHRQTSIVHGFQHSRNGSFASSNSPLSPQIIAAAGDASTPGDSSFAATMSSMTSGASFSSNTTLVPDRVSTSTDSGTNTLAQIRVERMHSGSGRSRRDYGHHPSHSRHHHKEELKTVGEYALHVLFTSVSNF